MVKANNLLTLPSRMENMSHVENLINSISLQHFICSETCGKISVAVLEAVNNAILHGNKLDYSKNVTIKVSVNERRFSCIVKDEGDGFDFLHIPDPTLPENIEKIHGRGVFLMNHFADSVHFSAEGRQVKMVFNL